MSSSTTTGWLRLTTSVSDLDVLAAEQPAGVAADDLGEVGGDDRRPVDDGRAAELGLVPQLGRDPLGRRRPNTGSWVGSPGSEPRSSPIASTVPGGASPRATSTPNSWIA